MEHRIIFATSNQGKMREIREILKGLGTEILSMKEAGLQTDVEENGKSFAENADIKATAIQKLSPGDIVLADDSGVASLLIFSIICCFDLIISLDDNTLLINK